MGLTYSISIANWIFLKKKYRNYFLLFFNDFKLLRFSDDIVKISEILSKWDLLKTYIKTTYPIIFFYFILFYFFFFYSLFISSE